MTHAMLDAAEYALYRLGWMHAPVALARIEEWGHHARNRPLAWRRIACRTSSGASLRIDVVGWDRSWAAYLSRLISRAAGGTCQTVEIGRVRAREIDARRAREAGSDAIFVETPDWKIGSWADQGFFVLPKRVSHLESLDPRDNPREIELRRAAEKLGLAMRVTRSASDLSAFYEAMYMPMVAKRHGDLARPTTLSVLRLALRWGALVQVFAGKEWVSGAMVAESPFDARALQILVIGVRDGDYDAIPDAARAAPVLFARDFARTRGFRICDHLVTPPFPSDGLFQRKQRWGTSVQDIPQRRDRVVFRVQRDSAGMRSLLSAMPFIARSAGGLETVRCPDALGAEDLADSLASLARSFRPLPVPPGSSPLDPSSASERLSILS
jgi:hypothetical protein